MVAPRDRLTEDDILTDLGFAAVDERELGIVRSCRHHERGVRQCHSDVCR